MPKIKNKPLKSILLDKEGFTMTVRQAQSKIQPAKKSEENKSQSHS